MKIRTIIGILVVAASLLSAAGCGPASPAAAPTVESSATIEAPTETLEPFPTDAPTEEVTATPEETGAAGTDTTPAADSTQAAATNTPNAGGGQPVINTDDKCQYISQTLPDGYQVRPNLSVTISWTIKNVGKTSWGTDYLHRFFYSNTGIKGTDKNLTKAVSANQSVELSATFKTPASPGDYQVWYKLSDPQLHNFCDMDFKFVVSNSPNNSGKPVASATP